MITIVIAQAMIPAGAVWSRMLRMFVFVEEDVAQEAERDKEPEEEDDDPVVAHSHCDRAERMESPPIRCVALDYLFCVHSLWTCSATVTRPRTTTGPRRALLRPVRPGTASSLDVVPSAEAQPAHWALNLLALAFVMIVVPTGEYFRSSTKGGIFEIGVPLAAMIAYFAPEDSPLYTEGSRLSHTNGLP